MPGIASKGTDLQLSVAAVFTSVGDIISVQHQGTDVGEFDGTPLNQATAGRRHIPTGYTEPGNVPFTKFFDPAATIDLTLTGKLVAPVLDSWKIIWSDGASTEWPFSGFLKKFDVAADQNNGLIADCNIQLDGLITYPT